MDKEPKFKLFTKVFFAVFLLILCGNILLVPKVIKAIPVEETVSVPEEITRTENFFLRILSKTGTIFFQNTLRKVLNEFAYDTATYLGSGIKGQRPAYVKEPWGDLWKNYGDKAAGDFIESFANTVISDIAASNIRKEGKIRCEKQMDECDENAKTQEEIDKCTAQYNKCIAKTGNKEVAESLCKDSYEQCNKRCEDNGQGSNQCEQNCRVIYESCYVNVGMAEKAPMLGLGSPLGNIDICNPSLSFAVRVGLGLVQYNVDYRPDCTWTKMKTNWTSFADKLADMSSDDYLKNMMTQFVDPTNSDLGVTFRLYTNMIEYRGKQADIIEKETIAKQGWVDARDWSGGLLGTPQEAEIRRTLTEQALWNNLGKVTGDILADAANIFLNQYAITAWQALMVDTGDSGGSLDFWNSRPLGRSNIENKINRIVEQQYPDDSNINLLAELASCPSSIKSPGPTNCVITSAFADAITEKKTVAQAIKDRNLPGNWPFGFNERGEEKLEYNQGYPYRSILILKKYRIIPVGWELAAQKIQQQYVDNEFSDTDKAGGITLQDMVDCFDLDDEFEGYKEEWCRGLVDPYWVLKLPKQYCAAKGYGPKLIQKPDAMITGNKFCSKDGGINTAKIDRRIVKCATDLDCCTKAELLKKDKYDPANPKHKAEIRKSCLAKCDYIEYKLTLARDDKYCADEQACIKEDESGNCLFFGYCTEERRKWVFSKDGLDKDCEPRFNTCQTFTSSKGRTVSYLQNTLDYGCTIDSIGCLKYSLNGDYSADNDKISWADEPSIHFNNQIKSCQNKDEGCHEFISLQEGSSANIIADSSFEDAKRWLSFGTVINSFDDKDLEEFVYSGTKSLKAEGQTGIVYSTTNPGILPDGFEFEMDRRYTLSAKVYVVSGGVEMSIGNTNENESWQSLYSTELGEWEQYILTINNDFTVNANSFFIKGTSNDSEFYIDDIKFEIGNYSNYSWYRSPESLVYQKLLPAYLEEICYENPPDNYSLKDNAPEKCYQFVRKCQSDEVGCELYTEVISKDETAAKVKPKDICPEECVGFDTFIQQENYFYSPRPDYFIPHTAKACSAQAEGCSLLVNLDKLEQGGESDEYYSELRQCIKPDNTCVEFYTWEGSDQTGYQLVVFSLKENQDPLSPISQPETVGDDDSTDYYDGDLCNEIVYSRPSDHPAYNPDCRQFYGRDGNVSYHLYSKTISCSNECFPYRKVDHNIDITIDTEWDCNQNGSHWDSTKQHCVVCLNNGIWMDEHEACVYYGMPSLSQSCSASQVGCSEYVGNFGNNVRFVINDDFEHGLNNWRDNLEISSDSYTRGGHSAKTTNKGWFKKDVKIKANRMYELSFVAKKYGENAIISLIGFFKEDGTGRIENNFANNVQLTGEWEIYKFMIDPINEDDIDYLSITLNGADSNSIRIDNIRLKEYNDRYYFIKNSWTTPDSCNQDYQGKPYPLYMLGCKQYYDSQNALHNLRSFSELCQLSAVGCQAMIDTYNSSYYGSNIYNDYDSNGNCYDEHGDYEDGCIVIPADEFAYIVYDKKKICASSQKGCQRLGRLSLYSDHYSDVYLLNDPDMYDQTLCTKHQVGCESWLTSEGSQIYFKDPANKVCEFIQPEGGTEKWFMKKLSYCVNEGEEVNNSSKICVNDTECDDSKRCVLYDKNLSYCVRTGENIDINNDKICINDTECDDNEKCVLHDGSCILDEPDPGSEIVPKTIGLGAKEEARQPLGMLNGGYAGACPKKKTGCTEYIDPESRPNANLANADFDENISLVANTLYIVEADSSKINISCNNDIYVLNSKNLLEHATNFDVEADYSEEFFINGNDNNEETCVFSDPAASIRKAIVAYKLKQTINPEKPIKVIFENGQILFNERSYNGLDIKNLAFNTIESEKKQAPSPIPEPPGDPPGNNANVLLKVDPDRECATWLGCKSYSINPLNKKDTICYERGLCNMLNDAGQCINFLDTEKENQSYESNINVADITNMTGYVKAGYDENKLNADYYHLASMTQLGEPRVKFDGSFENTMDSGFIRMDSTGTREEYEAPVIKDARIIEKELGYESYTQIPDGQAIAKTKSYVYKEVNNVGSNTYIASAYVFLKHGEKVDLYVQSINGSCPFIDDNGVSLCKDENSNDTLDYATLDYTTDVRKWVRLSG
ncbi:MAG: hypothetical protein ABIG10_01200, partial [bacterium]